MAASTARAAPGSQLERRFAKDLVCQARGGIVPLRTRASNRAELDTEVLFGECVTVLAYRRGWMRVLTHLDQKEGFVEPQYFSDKLFTPTHRVCVPSVLTTAYRPVQSHRIATLGMNTLVRVLHTPDKFSYLLGAGWVSRSCLKPIHECEEDFVEVWCRQHFSLPASRMFLETLDHRAGSLESRSRTRTDSVVVISCSGKGMWASWLTGATCFTLPTMSWRWSSSHCSASSIVGSVRNQKTRNT